MGLPLDRASIEDAFVKASRAELAALKPGNVHIHSAGHGMDISHFERAAEAAAPFLADPKRGVGARILGAVGASVGATGLNTNLGIVLLSAPLAAAAGARDGEGDLRQRLDHVLAALDLADADQAFQAIVVANPGGLGKVETGDVAAPPTMTLNEAMAIAAGRDRIARAYVTGFEDVFDFGLPTLKAARRVAVNDDLAITALHMSFLSSFPDSHIIRKYGEDVARSIQSEATEMKAHWWPAPQQNGLLKLHEFDANLKARGINPGTTADFVVATLFADLLIHRSATNKLS